jgi:3',5'-cyclic AMP phosphodiesterase CpdA
MMPSKENPLRFVHISDTHINPDTAYNNEYARHTPLVGAKALIEAVNALPFTPDFILHTGDVAFDPVPEAYAFIAELLSDLKAPLYFLRGNHDDSAAIQQILMKSEDIKPYLYYEFESKGVQILCLDSNGPHNPQNPSGFITEEQLEWHAILRQARDRLCGVFFGHIHHNYHILRDGVAYISGASSWTSLTSYAIPENTSHLDFPSEEDDISFNIVTITDTTSSVRRHGFRLKN